MGSKTLCSKRVPSLHFYLYCIMGMYGSTDNLFLKVHLFSFFILFFFRSWPFFPALEIFRPLLPSIFLYWFFFFFRFRWCNYRSKQRCHWMDIVLTPCIGC